MISHGRKSDEKCYVAGRTSKICRCDKGILHSGRNIMCCCLILEGKVMFRFPRSQDLLLLPSFMSGSLYHEIIIMAWLHERRFMKFVHVIVDCRHARG